ncbi:MAG: VCBS repeat-containing protein [Marinicella sp.]
MNRLYWLINLFWLALAVKANAQTAANGWVIEDIHGPSQVGIVDTIPVDINQDGRMDVVSASIEDGHLRAYINKGNYQFEQQYISKDVPGIYRVTATDIDGDGLTDFVLPSIETHEIIALINNSGKYVKQIIASGIVLPTDAQTGDFNNDGLMDIVSISYENHELLLHEQEPGGTFQTQVMSFSAENPRKIQVGDFNDDGLTDILLASSGDNSIRLYINLGSASFTEKTISNQMTGARYVAECDYNHDNLMDFVASATGDDAVYIFTNIGNFQFDPKPIDSDLPGASALYCADIDNDQQTELISIASSVGNIYTHELSADFERHLVANTRDGYVSVNIANFMPDDPPKILTQAYFENRNLLYSINHTNLESVVWEDFPDGLTSIQIDLNVPESYYYSAFRSGTVFNYEAGEVKRLFNGPKGVRALLLADINLDGFLDLFSVNSETDEAISHRNDGNGNFVSNVLFNQLQFPTASKTINLLGEQKTVVATTFDEFLWVFDDISVASLGDSFNGSFALDVADLNNDQLDDIVIADYIGGYINVALQNSKGEFQVIEVSSNKPRVFSVKTLDMDNDGDLDIVSSVNQNNQIWWHENVNLQFTDHLITSLVAAPRDLDVYETAGNKFIATSSFSPDGGVFLLSTQNGDQFNMQKIFQNLSGINTLKFVEEPEGLGILAGGFNDGRFIRLKQIDLIFKNSFE